MELKNLAHKGAKWRSVLVRKRKAIFNLGFREPNREKAKEDEDRIVVDEIARLKSDKSSISSEGEMGSWRGERKRGARRKRRGRERRREKIRMYWDCSILVIGFWGQFDEIRVENFWDLEGLLE